MLDTQKESGVFDGVPTAKDNRFSHACVPAAVLEGRWWLWACLKNPFVLSGENRSVNEGKITF